MYLLQANIRFRAELVDLTSARDITLNLATSRTTARSHVDPQASARSRVESQTGIQRKSISLDFVTSARQSKMEGIILVCPESSRSLDLVSLSFALV